MPAMPNIVAIIVARGGSKRLPGKNIRPLAGKPLIAYTIEAAKAARRLSKMIVSTDDPKIAEVAIDFGAEVPFLRPSELAQDQSPSLDVLRHAAEWLESQGQRIDAVVLLQPTSPMRNSRHIDEAIDLFVATGVDTVTAVSTAEDHPFWCWKVVETEIQPFFSRSHMSMRRELLPPAVVENGSIYIVRHGVLAAGSLYGERVAGYLMSRADAVDIDTIDDFEQAERLLSAGRNEAQ
jgi:CMP-N,N'-diacetyllegionaminic acid synthase